MALRRRILTIAYPLTRLGPAACGGTEQLALYLLRQFSRLPYSRRWELHTVAAAGSRAPGRVWPTNAGYWSSPERESHQVHDAGQKLLNDQHNAVARDALARAQREHRGFALIHNQGGDWYRHAAESPVPVLWTLHLPREYYPAGAFSAEAWNAPPPNLWLLCVSETQLRQYSERGPEALRRQLLGWIGNGVDLDWYSPAASGASASPAADSGYLLYLGRICPEKGAHLALELARHAGRPLILAGAVHPFPAHLDYFQRRIAPGIAPGVAPGAAPALARAHAPSLGPVNAPIYAPSVGGAARWLPAPSPREKLALLRGAAAVVLPSTVAETSSLTAMEAAACGRPVLALASGSLPEIVRHGETGFVAGSIAELAGYVPRLRELSPERCRRWAEERFDGRRMVAEYAALFERLAEQPDSRAIAA